MALVRGTMPSSFALTTTNAGGSPDEHALRTVPPITTIVPRIDIR
jgi:hypothetical protein